jgi:hypothetical protein
VPTILMCHAIFLLTMFSLSSTFWSALIRHGKLEQLSSNSQYQHIRSA